MSLSFPDGSEEKMRHRYASFKDRGTTAHLPIRRRRIEFNDIKGEENMRLTIGVPDPSARHEEVRPTEKDWLLGEESVSGWAAVPSPDDPNTWIYFWLEGPLESARYRCYLETQQPTPWRPLRTSTEVFATTGYDEEDEEPDEPGAELGAAERLPPGIYKLDFLCPHNGEDVCLDGIRFEVSATERPLPGTILEVELPNSRRPWWKLW
jgi:hypothetical protein